MLDFWKCSECGRVGQYGRGNPTSPKATRRCPICLRDFHVCCMDEEDARRVVRALALGGHKDCVKDGAA